MKSPLPEKAKKTKPLAVSEVGDEWKLRLYVALPTLVRHLTEPIKRIVGDLSNSTRVIVGMELERMAPPAT